MSVKIKTKRAKSGFTLVEVCIACVIMALVLGGSYTVITQAMQISRMARNHYVAVNIAKNRIERSQTFSYGSLSLMAESALVVDDNGTPNTVGTFKRTTTVNTNYAANLTQVTCTVQMRNVKTGAWGAQEQVASLFVSP